MKLNKLFLMAVMGLGLFACSENELEGNGPEGAQNEGTTYVGFSLKFNDPNTRATKTEDGNPVEQKINTAYVMMADASGNVEQIVSTADRGKGDNNTNTNYYVFQTTAGVHYFYAVVNPDVIPTITEANNGTAETIEKYFNTGVALTVAKIASTTGEGNFMMASDAVKEVYVEDGVTKDEALKGTKNCFAIQVERATAKVTMTCEKETLENAVGIPNDPEYGGKVSNLKFNLKGVANMAYRMAQSEWKNIPNNSWTPNEDGTVNNNTLDVSVVIGQDYKAVNAAYCLENMDSPYKQGNTTYLTLQTTFIPARVVNCESEVTVGALKDNPNAANSKAASFYVVKTGKLAGNYILKDDLDSYQLTNPGKYPNGVESISAEYKEGTCWFGPIWIGQTNAADQNGPVVRNTWYNLNITGIALPGEPQEPQPDPDQPLVPTTNVAITLTVMPWNFIDRGIDLQ